MKYTTKEKWLKIWLLYSIVGFILGEVWMRYVWGRLNSIFTGSLTERQMEGLSALYNSHYLVSFSMFILIGTFGLAIHFVKEEIKKDSLEDC